MPAHFFCDNCGTEVNRSSDRCPKCGRYFAFVRCPQCDYTGEEGEFAKGCPACGYCTQNTPQKGNPRGKSSKPSLIEAGKLSLWVYIVASLGLALVLLVLYLLIK